MPITRSFFSASDEVDLRQGADHFFTKHQHKVLLRVMRRDSSRNLIDCVCKSKKTLEPDWNDHCPYCLGEGHYWDESWVVCRSEYVGANGGLARRNRWAPPGLTRLDSKLFFFPYDTVLTYDDKIVEVQLGVDGKPVVPEIRESIYKIETCDYKRSDGGRVEFLEVFAREEYNLTRKSNS